MLSLRTNRQLTVDFTQTLSGNIIYSACQWCIVLFLAKLGSSEQVGEYALGMAVSAPIVLFANLQVRTLLASDVRDEFTFGRYLTFCLVSLSVALLAIASVAAWTAPDLRRAGIIVLVGFAQVLEYISDTYYGLMQKYNRMDRLARSLTLKGPLSLAALWVAMYVTRSVTWALVGLALGRLFILLIWDSRLGYTRKAGHEVAARLEWNSADMLRLLRTALPLGVISMLASLSSNIPRYFVDAYRGAAELGIYSALASLVSAGNLAVSAFGQSIMVPAAKACAQGDRGRYRGFVIQAVALGAILGGGAVVIAGLFGRQILGHIFRPEYGERADIFVWLMGAGTLMFITSGLGYVMTAARALHPQIPLLLANGLAATATSAGSIPKHGLRGAVDAAFVASLVQLFGSGMILWRIDRNLKATMDPFIPTEQEVTLESSRVEV